MTYVGFNNYESHDLDTRSGMTFILCAALLSLCVFRVNGLVLTCTAARSFTSSARSHAGVAREEGNHDDRYHPEDTEFILIQYAGIMLLRRHGVYNISRKESRQHHP